MVERSRTTVWVTVVTLQPNVLPVLLPNDLGTTKEECHRAHLAWLEDFAGCPACSVRVEAEAACPMLSVAAATMILGGY